MAAASFVPFFETWLARQETLVEQLETLSSPAADGFDKNQECIDIIPRVFSHYQQLFQEKARAFTEDIVLLVSPPWLSSFELSMLWLFGFRPSILFPIIDRSIGRDELTAEQRQGIAAVRAETRRRERKITQDMARVQESVAEPPVYGLARKYGRLVDGEVECFDDAVEGMKAAMAMVAANADDLRTWTTAKLAEVLTPVQIVRVLAAVGRFQLRIRRWGMEKDSERDRDRDRDRIGD